MRNVGIKLSPAGNTVEVRVKKPGTLTNRVISSRHRLGRL